MKILEFKDIVKADVTELSVSRINMHNGIKLLFLGWLSVMFISLGLYMINYHFSALFFLGLGIIYVALIMALVIKREIYSVMIYLKDKEKHEWRPD